MVDTNDKGTESDEDEEMLEAFSLSSKDLETPAAGVGLKHLLPIIAGGSSARKALDQRRRGRYHGVVGGSITNANNKTKKIKSRYGSRKSTAFNSRW